MRKEYKKPIVAAVMLNTEPMMNTTSAETGGVNIGNKPKNIFTKYKTTIPANGTNIPLLNT